MSTEVLMPQMGESIAEGTISKWLVKEGDKVERDQPLFEISTDKVDAEIPSPATGVLQEIRHGEGDTVSVDDVVALIGEAGETPTSAPKAEPAPAPEASGVPAGRAASEPQAAAAPEQPAAASEPAAAAPAEAPAETPSETVSAADEELADRVRRASSPVVRKIAAEEDVDLSQVEGTGIHGRVTKDDIMGYLQKREEPAAAASTAPAVREEAAPTTAPARREVGGFSVAPYSEGENVDIEPMSRIRQITAAHMAYSKATSAHVTTVFHIDMSKVHAKREAAKAGFAKAHGTKLTYMPFIFKAVAAALREHRKLNAAIDGTNIVFKRDINLGMAVALDWGLLVPVIRNADQLNLVGLTKNANDLADRARGKKLKPEEIQGGTFTITNPGVFGSLFGTPIINQPQVAILGIGTIEKRPVVVRDTEGNDTIAIKTMSYFGITYDHRLVDGADADHFMNDVKKGLLEDSWSELDPYL